MTDDSQRDERLPMALQGRFWPWRYSVSHSELEIRSVHDPNRITSLMFYGVLSVKLKSLYSPLVVSEADDTFAHQVVAFAGLSGSSVGRIRVMLLSDDVSQSFVACLSLVVREYGNAGGLSISDIPEGESRLIFRT